MKNKLFLKTLQLLCFLLFFLIAGWGIQPKSFAQRQTNRATLVQPQDLQRLRIPPELLRQTLTTVPRLEGRPYNQQTLPQVLARAGLVPGDAVPVVNNDQIGIIISQTPAPGQQVRRGTPVSITYGIQGGAATSNQPENVTVPNYIGLTLERATGRMPNDRLQPGDIKETPSDAVAGIVVDQFPQAGMVVDPQTPINLTISTGPQPVTQIQVPNLRGLTLEQAANVLRESKLFAGRLREEVSDERPGVVLSQSPRAGTMVSLESAVDITFSAPPPEENDIVMVPDVTGLPKDEAILVLKQSRLNYLLKYEKRSGEPKNVVAEQDPLPETRVAAGTAVQLIISKSKTVPPWIYWGGGVLVAGLLGGFVGRKWGGRKDKTVGQKDTTLHLKPVLDKGKQSIEKEENGIIREYLHLKLVPDKGTQSIKSN